MTNEGFIILTICAIVGYFMPAFVAFGRKHHNASAICMLNLLLGWTVLGWVGALVWAMTTVKRQAKQCPRCKDWAVYEQVCVTCGAHQLGSHL